MKQLKTTLITIAAILASLGTLPYGYRFAQSLLGHHNSFILVMGFVFAATAALSNATLSAYSLLAIQRKETILHPYLLSLISFSSAIPSGFMSYFGYQPLLSSSLNLCIAIAVLISNTGIGFTAISNLYLELKQLASHSIDQGEILSRLLGFIIGIIVSSLMYVTATSGLSYLLETIGMTTNLAQSFSYFLAFIVWIPSAALYSNALQITAAQIYFFLNDFTKHRHQFNFVNSFIAFIACGAGASFAQIAIEFFSLSNPMPHFFKYTLIQAFIHTFLIPITFIACLAVNFISLKKVISRWIT